MTPDQRIALTNHLMRERIAPALPPGHCATLLVFEARPNGMVSYISSGDRASMREALREILAKWDADEAAQILEGRDR